MSELSQVQRLELGVDVRLAELWAEADKVEEWTLEAVAAFMRAAYGRGYVDALEEERKGDLCIEYGYRVPGQETV